MSTAVETNSDDTASHEDLYSESGRICVVVDQADGQHCLIALGKQLADSMQLPWEAIYVETPQSLRSGSLTLVGDALAIAARWGAMVYRLPSPSVADALSQHISGAALPHVVLATRPRGPVARLFHSSLAEELARRDSRIVFHSLVLPLADAEATSRPNPTPAQHIP